RRLLPAPLHRAPRRPGAQPAPRPRRGPAGGARRVRGGRRRVRATLPRGRRHRILLTAPLLAAAASFHVQHPPPSRRAPLRVLFRADDGPFYAAALRSDVPCHAGVLPRPSKSAARVTYAF